jgi:hypothetical protein
VRRKIQSRWDTHILCIIYATERVPRPAAGRGG